MVLSISGGEQSEPNIPLDTGCPRSDTESVSDKEGRRRKRMKCALYIGIFAVLQLIVILMFVLVVVGIRRPKFCLGQPRIQSLTTGTAPFDLSFVIPIRIKSANFGPYKNDVTDATFSYSRVALGQVTDLTDLRVWLKFSSTEKVNLTVSLDSNALASTSLNASLGTELSSGTLTLSSSGKMTGKAEVMKTLLQQKKSSDMSCTMAIAASTRTVRSVSCK